MTKRQQRKKPSYTSARQAQCAARVWARGQGFSLVELLIVVTVIGIIAAIALPNLLSSRRAANEGSAVSSLRVINSAQLAYLSTFGSGRFADNLATLGSVLHIDARVASGTKSGYNLNCQRLAPLPSHPDRFDVTATPIGFGTIAATGHYSFYSNETGALYRTPAPSGTAPTSDPLTRAITNGIPIE